MVIIRQTIRQQGIIKLIIRLITIIKLTIIIIKQTIRLTTIIRQIIRLVIIIRLILIIKLTIQQIIRL